MDLEELFLEMRLEFIEEHPDLEPKTQFLEVKGGGQANPLPHKLNPIEENEFLDLKMQFLEEKGGRHGKPPLPTLKHDDPNGENTILDPKMQFLDEKGGGA